MTFSQTLRRAGTPILVTFALAGFGCSEQPSETPAATETAASDGDYRCVDCNVLVVSVDTLRADHLGIYGYERDTTPNLENFIIEAMVFDRFFYNGGGTLPSHMTMMTSLHPATHRVEPSQLKALEPSRVTLAEVLHDAGYATGGFVDGGWVRGEFGFAQGFDVYDDEGGRLEAIMPRAERWIERNRDQPFFVFLHTYDVHSQHLKEPYDCPSELKDRFTGPYITNFDGCKFGHCASRLLSWHNQQVREETMTTSEIFSDKEIEFMKARYDGCIRYVDQKLANFFGWLRSLDEFDNTMIVVLSDHGEEFLEHGQLIHDDGGYEEYAHLPLIVKMPKSFAGGTRHDQMISMADIMPTILDVVGLERPEDAQGRSALKSLVRDNEHRDEVHMYSVLRTDRYKYFSDKNELFDLETDPGEQTNLYAESAETVADLESRVRSLIRTDLQAWEAFRKTESANAVEMELSAEEIESLKALGYLN